MVSINIVWKSKFDLQFMGATWKPLSLTYFFDNNICCSEIEVKYIKFPWQSDVDLEDNEENLLPNILETI